MAYRSLAEFLEELDAAGELARVATEVDSFLEIAEITDRVHRAAGPALLFQQVRGHAMPVVTNLLGTESRLCRALGIESLEELGNHLAAILHPPAASEGWLAALRPAPDYAALAKLAPKIVKAGPCQQVVRLASDVDLGQLPALQCRPLEAGRSIPRAKLFARSGETGARHVGVYDLALLDRDRLAVLWHAPQAGPGLLAEYRQKGERMPAAVVLGGDPACDLAAAAPLPPQIDPLLLAGLLRGKSIDLVRCRACELEVPCDAELVVEGYLDPAEPPIEVGPWAAATGFYRPRGTAPVLHVTAVTHRANPVFPAVVVGQPPGEWSVIEKAIERLFVPVVKLAVPELVDYSMPALGGRSFVFLSFRKTYPGQARKVASAVWGLDYLARTKILVLVDAGVDVHRAEDVWFHVGANLNPARDVFFREGPADALDHAAPAPLLGQKMAIDATAKLPEECGRPWPAETAMTQEIRDLVEGRWAEYGLERGQ